MFLQYEMSTKRLELKIFSGTANIDLAKSIVNVLGLELGDAGVGKFSNGETSVALKESCM